MNLFELLYVIAIVGGAVVGGNAGRAFGIPGVLAGTILGGIVGCAAIYALSMLIALLARLFLGRPFLKPKTRDTFGSDHKNSD